MISQYLIRDRRVCATVYLRAGGVEVEQVRATGHQLARNRDRTRTVVQNDHLQGYGS